VELRKFMEPRPRDGDATQNCLIRTRGHGRARFLSEVDEVLESASWKSAGQDITIIMIEHIMQAVMRFRTA